MPPLASFAALGLFVREAFLSPSECRMLARQMLAQTGDEATVFGARGDGAVHPDVRRAWEVEVGTDAEALVAARLRALAPALEAHFSVALGEPEAPSYVRYPPGAFYRAHRDRRATPDPSHAERRAVSAVLFVNGPGDEPGFRGGQLRFYGLLGEGRLADVGLDLEPRAGGLVAFASTLEHEVTTVEDGVRLTIVTWFPDRSAA